MVYGTFDMDASTPLTQAALRRAGVTQRALARAAGVSEPHVSLAVRGRRDPGPRLLRAWRLLVEPALHERRVRLAGRLLEMLAVAEASHRPGIEGRP
jgi:transcriptional regulator with XRE-family HTH domain